MKHLSTLAFLFGLLPAAYATHLLGGEIQVSRLTSQSLTYQFKVNLFMDDVNGALAGEGQNQITICVGESGKTITAKRLSRIKVAPSVSLNSYGESFTYGSPGTFTVSVAIDNRSAGISNLNTGNISLYFQTTFAANIINTTPVLNSPIGTQPAYSKQLYTDNVNAVDAEGDSLVYRLGVSKQRQGDNCTGKTISDYRYPNEVTRQGTFKIDAQTGELTWNAPIQVGSYAYTVIVEEWRDGVLISETQREVTLEVTDRGGDPIPIPPFEYPGNGLITSIEPELREVLQVSPSPARSRVKAAYATSKPARVLFQLVDIKGKIVEEYQETERYLTHSHDFYVGNLPQGLYFIRMIADKTVTVKFIKE
ncbi:MAG: T9SS type A sorting domain-containing protein [Spirosomataceae bacterium]